MRRNTEEEVVIYARPSDAIDPSRTRRSTGGECTAEGCTNRTREGKPFCSDHVRNMAYVAGVIARADAFERELKRIQGGGHVQVQGVLAQDILGLVNARGILYTVHVSHEYKLDLDALEKVFRALARAGLVKLKKHGGAIAAFPAETAA